MKKILFATTALAGLAIAGVASAEIALFGDARLGIGYNINNNGSTEFKDHRPGRSPSTTTANWKPPRTCARSPASGSA